jgi:hypothetical protein
VPYGYLIELKYVTRGEWNEALGQEKLAEAQEQLARYAHDPRMLAIQGTVQLKHVALVYAGWELKMMTEW